MAQRLLRSSVGCLRCRQRKIKCGEEHPICARCARWDFECIWPSQQQPKSDKTELDSTKTFLTLNHGSGASSLQCYQDGYLAAGYESFQNENQRQVVESAVEFVRRYTSFGIRSGRGDLSFLTTLILQTSSSRFALSAFTAGAISRWDNRFKTIALSSHQAAVVELRFNVSSGSALDNDVRLLTSIFFLGMMEYFANGNPRMAYNHFSVIARMAVTIQEKLSNSLKDASSRWTIVMINMSIVLCANSFWIEPRLHTLFEGEWDVLDKFYSHCVQPMADTYKICLPEDGLRVMVQLHMNRMIFKGPALSCFRTVLRRIDDMERFITTSNPVSTQPSNSNTEIGWAAEICGMRLYAAAVAQTNTCSNDQQLRALAHEWREYNTRYLQSVDKSMAHMEALLPMTKLSLMGQLGIGLYYLPLFCIIHELEWFEEIVDVYNSLDIVLDAFTAVKIQRVIESIRSRKKTMHCTLEIDGKCSARHDGLDILRHPQGILC